MNWRGNMIECFPSSDWCCIMCRRREGKESETGMKNPQADFEDSIFGPNGTHPTPKTLPYPTQTIQTIYGETIEYLIPQGQKEKVLKKLYPFGDPPPLTSVYIDIHSKKEFKIADFRVVEQNGYVMPVSPYFAEDGASVVDWEPKSAAESGIHVAPLVDELVEAAYAAGRADAFTGMPKGTARPARGEGVSSKRARLIEAAYDDGYADGLAESNAQRDPFMSFFAAGTGRRTGRRPR